MILSESTEQELIEYKESLKHKIQQYQKIAQKIHAFVHVTNRQTGELIWHNKPPHHILKYVYSSCESRLSAYWQENYALDDFRQLVLDICHNKEAVGEYATKRLYQLPYEEDLFFYVYESVTIQDDKIIGITVDVTHQIHTRQSLQTLVRENKQLHKQLEIAKLSPKEQEVLALLAQGGSTKAIAEKLDRSYYTIQSYRKRLLQKLACKSVVELTRFAIESGLY